jgi:phosphoribosyl-dephospho-CoA transferase
LREQRDAAVEDMRRRYAPKLATLQDRIRAAEDRAAREKDQLKSQKINTALSVGVSILGAVFGSRRITATNIGRVASAARTAGRLGREKDDVDRAEDSLDVLQQRLEELKAECEAETTKLAQSLDAAAISLRSVQLTPRKSDIAIGEVALVWAPWRKAADGFPAPAFD